MRRACIALLIAVLWTPAVSGEVPLVATEPPAVTKVVLYKHGMGYIEREGKVKGNALLTLAFRADQMKDLLTSFFAVDLGKGRISSVRYETRDPLSRQLQDILIKVPEEAALSQFLMQLKGARLSAKAAGETIEGRILGIEPVTEVVNNQTIKKGFRLVLLTNSGPIRTIDLFSISELALADEVLQRDLSRLLDLSLDSKYSNRKKLTVSATGEGERDLRIGYLIEMPIWKCSYRVIFDPKKKDSPPLLQGWALAENNTEDDWKDITISFVAGAPLSYVMDLYSPYYVRRMQVPVPGLQGLAVDWGSVSPPDLAEGPPASKPAAQSSGPPVARRDRGVASVAQTIDRPAGRRITASAGGGGGAGSSSGDGGAGGAADHEDSRPLGELLTSSYDSDTRGAKVGDLFSYEPKEKISIPRGQAAMAPIISRQVNGNRLLYYKASFSPKVVSACVLQNATDLTLEAGAVTFFEGSTSLGEGILGHTLPPGNQEVVPYALDASVDVVPQQKTLREPHFKARLADGILTLTAVESLTNTWKIVNRGKESAVLWLHQPKNVNFRLSKPDKPLKEVDNHYRFEVPLKAGESLDFLVEEKRDVQETVQLAKCGEEQIRVYMSQPYLSKGARVFLKDLGDLMANKTALQREMTELTQQSKRLAEEQGRIRSNLQALGSNQPKEQELRAKWISALAGNEDQLATCRAKLDDAGVQVQKLEESLAKKVRDYKDE